MGKSMEERLADLQKRKQQLTEQEKLLKARMSQENRKKRTRRLIQNGALAEKYFNCEGIDPVQFKKLLELIVNLQEVKLIISRALAQGIEDQVHEKTMP